MYNTFFPTHAFVSRKSTPCRRYSASSIKQKTTHFHMENQVEPGKEDQILSLVNSKRRLTSIVSIARQSFNSDKVLSGCKSPHRLTIDRVCDRMQHARALSF